MSFKDWWTNENNPSLPKEVYLYGTRHIVVLVLTLFACVFFSVIFFKRNEKAKRILFLIFAYIFLFFEILTRIVNLIIADNYTWQSVLKILLPMHFCSVMVWIFIFAIFSKKQWLVNFAVTGGLLATLAFLLYPSVGLNKTYMSFTCVYSTFTHMLGFVTAILLMTLGVAKFEFKRLWINYLCFIFLFGWGALLSYIIFPGSDYMYVRNDPLELGLNFPYQILYIAIIVVYILMFYLVKWGIVKIRKNNRPKHNNIAGV